MEPGGEYFDRQRPKTMLIAALEECLVSWLERSKAQPLRVTLINAHRDDAESNPAPYIAAFDSLWSVLSSSSSRWVELQVTDYRSGGRMLLHGLHPGGVNPGPAGPLSLAVPNITSLDFEGWAEEFASLSSRRWTTIVSLAVDLCEPNAVLGLLEACPALVDLTLRNHVAGRRDPGPYLREKTVKLPHLKAITFVGSAPPPDLHKAFDIPSLNSFALVTTSKGGCMDGRDQKLSEASLMAWMERFGGGITDFAIKGEGIRPSCWWLLEFFRANLIPNVKNITHLGRVDYDMLLDRLLKTLPDGGIRYSHLESFVSVPQAHCIPWHSENGALRFVESRLGRASENSLRFVHVAVVDYQVPDRDIERKGMGLVARLRSRGVDLRGVRIKITYTFSVDGKMRKSDDQWKSWRSLVIDCGEVFVHYRGLSPGRNL
jgi:hypothetical protein